MDKQDIAIEVKNLSKDFILPHKDRKTLKSFFLNPFSKVTNEKQHALNNVSFEVKKGDFFGIVGRNGSGKSTLLKCIAGVYHPTKGHIKVNGSLVPFIELGVGFNPELTGRENVFLNGSLLGFSRQEMDAMYDEIVDFSELEKFMDQKLKNYSSGMQVRLGFSIAIQAKGDILLLDEVLAVGDAAFQQKCNNYFEELKSTNQTVVLVSHNMEAIKRFCSKAVFIKDGEIAKEGNVYEVSDAYLMDNLDQSKKVQKESSKNKIEYLIKNEDHKQIKIKANYDCGENKCFASLSIWKDGIYIGGISTEKEKPIEESGSLEFTIDKDILNPGTYGIGGGLFKANNNSQLAVIKASERNIFIIQGEEKRRGGALKLKDTWKYGS
jgi:ABC-type polysaccharide/polyol phosphate transport system ATPase subunit